MLNTIIIFFCKLISYISQNLNLGHGSTWPGHIALKINPYFINQILGKSKTKIILVTGTNGKTTTAKLLQTILESNGRKVILNSSGANLLNGIASALITSSDTSGKLNKDFAIFEVDENTLPQIVKVIEPDYIIALNLFRDQLDRYGEIDTIAKKWREAYSKLIKTQFILNADDPQIAFLGNGLTNAHYFGLESKGNNKTEHASDSILCPKCTNRLTFTKHYFSHLGDWSCASCGLKRPLREIDSDLFYPLSGDYAIYDIQAAALLAKLIGLNKEQINQGLKNFKPAFGRQEIIKITNKEIQLFLSKNPTSLNESLSTAKDLGAKTLLFVLNDKIPDGLDVSWIWDVNFEQLLSKDMNIIVSGLRAYDMAIRLKYTGFFVHIVVDVEKAIKVAIKSLENDEKLYILPNYSAMLEARKVLTGKKIL